MQFVVPDWLVAENNNMDTPFNTGADLLLTILVKNPNFYSDPGAPIGAGDNAHISSFTTLSSLLAHPAWQAASDGMEPDAAGNGDIRTVSLVDTTPTGGETREVSIASGGFEYESAAPVIATGFVLSFVHAGQPHDGKIAMIFRPEEPIYLVGAVGGQATAITATSWLNYAPRNGVNDDAGWIAGIGDVAIAVPTLAWESPRSAHVFLDPMRINYVVNPTFESVSAGSTPFGWRSNATTFERVAGGITRYGTPHSCHLSKVSGPIIAESNYFPATYDTPNWSVSAQVSGNGRARVGMVWFPENMNPNEVFYVHSPWVTLGPAASSAQADFREIHVNFPAMETMKEALVRIEFDGTECWIDDVIAEPVDGNPGYFDGSFDLGQPTDFSWYGGAGKNHKSYSLFYNNRANLKSTLFGYIDSVTEERYRGEAQRWVPEGIQVIPHYDDVFSLRIHSWLDDFYFPIKDYVTKNVVTTIPA